jgi:methylenetetrahydrofolate dehydrogenase (NADP+)/methenyltetrahydrofolate cyclohydrolase
MSAIIIDGKATGHKLQEHLKQTISNLPNTQRKPCLAVILVGADPASNVYVSHKVKACEAIGMESILERYEATLSQQALLERIAQLNENKTIDGILVQLPLPKHIDPQAVIAAIAPHKDVDGFHAINAGQLMLGQPLFKPCTPYGCMVLLEQLEVDLKGMHAVIVGASNIVGKPMAMLLLQAGCTVTICNSKTKDLKAHTSMADIVVMAVGKPNLLSAEFIKKGSIIIDVGINRLANGQLCGDVDFASVQEKASYITPVPGGVGPMTITMLLTNTLQAYENSLFKEVVPCS